MRRTWAKRILAIVVGLGVSLAVLEVGLALTWPQATKTRLLAQSMGSFVPSDLLPYTLRPNSSSGLKRQEFDTRIHVNGLGFRGAEMELDDDALRILIVGDSFTFGWGVEDDETYPARMQVHLDELLGPGRTQVLNAGFAACYYPDTYYLWLKEVGMAFEPDLVVVGFYLGNDVDHERVQEHEWPEVDDDGLPLRIRNVREDIADGQRVARTPALRYRYPLLSESHLFQLLAKVVAGPISPALRQESRRNVQEPTLADLRNAQRRNGNFNEFMYRAEYLVRTRTVVRRVQALFVAMQKLTADQDVPLAVVMIPAREQIYPEAFALDRIPGEIDLEKPQRVFGEFFADRQVPCLDLLPALREPSRRRLLYFLEDPHFTRAGNEVSARLIGSWLVEAGLVD